MCILLDQALDQWNALVEQEEAYKVRSPSSLEQQVGPTEQRYPSSAHTTVHSCPSAWREKICEWCYQVIDHCDIDRGVVSIALSYFDRFTSCTSSEAGTSFQLVAMTSLYLAAKLHSTRKISASSMSSLSKGCYRVDHILNMEICICQTLHWRLNPPTPSTCLDAVIPLIEASVNDEQASYEITEFSRYLLELGVCDSYFIDKRPPSIAYASISVAMENLSTSEKIKIQFGMNQLDKSPHVTERCAERLRHLYRLTMSTLSEEEEGEASRAVSPTSVQEYC